MRNIKREYEKNFRLIAHTYFANWLCRVFSFTRTSSTAVTGGNIAQSAFSSAVNYGVKKQTGKSPMEHAMAYAEEINPQKKKEPCLSFVQKQTQKYALL